MRKSACIIALIFVAIFVVGCSNDESSNSSTAGTLEETESAATDKTSGDGPLIDPSNPHNEREEIITMIEGQKELLKLGFVKEDTAAHNISTYRFIEGDHDEGFYDVGYSEHYRSENSDHAISLGTEAFVCQDGLDEWSSDLEEREAFEDDRIEGYYGHAEYGSSNIFVKHQDICYSGFISGDDDVYDEKDKRLLDLLTKTIKTEAEGAYEPLYTRFTMDLNNIKFPALNQASTTLRSVSIAYAERTYEPNHSNVSATYIIGEEVIAYEITDEEDTTKGREFQEELETENGVPISKYVDTTIGTEYYHWEHGGYTYIISVSDYKRELTDEDVFEIIDSAMADERSFENIDFFQGVHDKANLDEHGVEILEDYYY